MFLDGLDELDQKIVQLLIQNARMPYADIGKQVGLSRLLEKNDTITQIYRVTGKSRLHVHAVAASNEEMEKLIYETIDRLPGVTQCSCNMIFSRIKDIKGLRL